MAATPIAHRPQTLKQAKKAFKKSGAKVRLSESELAVIERRAVLQERADRIKAREGRRRANIKQKEERNQREKDERQRMGIPMPAKEGIHIGPSQLDLGQFLGGVQKSLGATGPKATKATTHDKAKLIGTGVKNASAVIMGPPTRPALEVISHNSTSQSGQHTAEPSPKLQQVVDESFDNFFVSNTQIQRELSSGPIKPMPRAQIPLTHAAPRQALETAVMRSDVEDFVAQILTQDLNSSALFTQVPHNGPLGYSQETFGNISTQDLKSFDSTKLASPRKQPKYTQFLAQISSQDLDFSDPSSQALTPEVPARSEFDEDELTDYDLEDLALELEHPLSTDTRKAPTNSRQTCHNLEGLVEEIHQPIKVHITQALSHDNESFGDDSCFDDEFVEFT